MSLIKWRQRAPAETPSMSERESSACVVFSKAKKKNTFIYIGMIIIMIII